jgi:hypothetical protein
MSLSGAHAHSNGGNRRGRDGARDHRGQTQAHTKAIQRSRRSPIPRASTDDSGMTGNARATVAGPATSTVVLETSRSVPGNIAFHDKRAM